MSPCQEALLPSTYCYPSRTIARSIDEVPFVDGLPESPRNSSPHTAGDSLLQLSTLPPEVSGTGIDHLYSDDTCELVTYGSLWQSPSLFRVEKLIGSAPRYTSTTTQSKFSQIVQSPIFIHILGYLNHKRLLKTRRVSKAWKSAVECVRPLKFPTVYYLPVELIQQILLLSSASSFENARKTCRAWYYSSLETFLLQHHLNSMGFSRSDPLVCVSKNPVYLSRRLSRECSLGSDGSGKCRIRKAAVLDMSEMATTEIVNFTVSKCGSHVLLSEGCIVYVYRIEPGSDTLMEFVASIVCPRRVLAVSMDTSNMRYSVAILLDGRVGLVHDIVEQEAKSMYKNLCSEDDAPRSVAICPQRRCVAFGCQGGIELHWVDALTGQDLNRWFPLTAPSDFLYFLPPRQGIDSTKKLRLISSSVHPKEVNPLEKRFGTNRSSLAHWGSSWEPGKGQSDHFQAVPLSDGYHILFTDPQSGGLCLGSDAPLGGPTKLLRKFWLVPPESLACRAGKASVDEEDLDTWIKTIDQSELQIRPSIYASGTDLRYGVRVVASYGDSIVLFSIPPDIFKYVGRRDNKDEQCNGFQNDFGSPVETFHMEPAYSNAPKPFRIRGCLVDTVPGIVDLAVDSGPTMTVYALSSNGVATVYKLEGTFSQNGGQIVRTAIGHESPSLEKSSYGIAGLDGASCNQYEPLWGDQYLDRLKYHQQLWSSEMWPLLSTTGMLEYDDFIGYS